MFLRILSSVLLEGFAFEDCDVVGKANVETANAFETADVGIEIPDVLVALMTCEIVFGTGKLLDKEVLGHEVELEGDVDLHIIIGHVEHIDEDGFVTFCVGPGFVGKDFYIANAVEIEDTRAVPIDVVRDHEVVFGPHIVGFDQAIFYPTAVVGGVAVEDGAALLGIGLLQEGDGCCTILVGEHLAVEHLQAELFWHDA